MYLTERKKLLGTKIKAAQNFLFQKFLLAASWEKL